MTTSNQGRSLDRKPLRRVGELALQVLSFFVILEPVWMLLPFAGFLYGSVLQIEALGQNPATAWLTHFVFPVLTLGWSGPVLVLIGFAVFLVGAGQIYWAKFHRTGLVTGGLYRWVRHPQYIALTLFGVGILLTWGRAITFIAFFVMMFLYYYLARSEERNCIRLFGEAYERYRERVSFIVPGDILLRPLAAKMPRAAWPAPIRVSAAFVVTMAVCFGLMWAIHAVKVAVQRVPYLTATVPFGPIHEAAAQLDITAGESRGVSFVQAGRVAVVRGPYRNAMASGFAERVLLRLRQSQSLKEFLGFLDQPDGDVAIVFCAPFEIPDQPGTPGMPAGRAPGGRGPAPDPSGPNRVRLILMRCTLAAGASLGDALADKSKRQIRAGCIAPINLNQPEAEDIVEGKVVRPGPRFPGEERWDFLLHQLAAQPGATQGARGVAVPGRAASATLVLVRAPILRTRLDPPFAEEILDRLVESAKFREHLRNTGVGDEVVAVAFPRPGPNWYREHHGQPQVSVFVMLARLAPSASLETLFRAGGRKLDSAFIADVDFKLDRSTDSVVEITPIGPRRDLEERWQFFLSGVVNGSPGYRPPVTRTPSRPPAVFNAPKP